MEKSAINKKLVIFGASGGGIKVAKTLKSFGIEFIGFLDNDSQKWGTQIEGKTVMSPEILLQDDYGIIIASTHQAEIEQQLEEMGQLENHILKDEIIIKEVLKLMTEIKKPDTKLIQPAEQKIIMDLSEGWMLGGIETWVSTVTRELKNIGAPVVIYSSDDGEKTNEDLLNCIQFYPIRYTAYRENVIMLAEQFLKQGFCTAIVNKYTQFYYAAILAKQISPETVNIVCVIHSDSIYHYHRQKLLAQYVDKIVCVSKRICKRMINEAGISEEKIYYKESPVYVGELKKRDYTIDSQYPIKLGYAGRVTKMVKRADYLCDLIARLEKKNVYYEFFIAGDGPYKNTMERYIKEHNLENKVYMLGKIDHSEISEFWKTKDVFISVSDSEGSSLSELEAMSFGAIPVETDVSGVEEFVKPGENGFVVDVGDIESLAEHIAFLEKNRHLLSEMGKKSYEVVRLKCNPKEYAEFIWKISCL